MSMKREVTQKVIEKVIPATIVKEIQEVETLVVTLDGPKGVKPFCATLKDSALACKEAKRLLNRAFDWIDTPEGEDFWLYVHKRLEVMEDQFLCMHNKQLSK